MTRNTNPDARTVTEIRQSAAEESPNSTPIPQYKGLRILIDFKHKGHINGVIGVDPDRLPAVF